MEKFEYKKSLGQNFLHDNEVIENIINSISFSKGDLVIEIGPGSGALTRELVKKDGNIISFEIDERLKRFLEPLEEKNTNLKVIYEDFLNSDLEKCLEGRSYNNVFVVANLPYYITTPIIKKIISSNLKVSAMVLMVQEEVGLRFLAEPKSKLYNSLSIFLQYYFDIKKICTVSKESFIPKPNVDSIVVYFESKDRELLPKNEEFFFDLVRESFKFKRKTLRNNLKNYDNKKLVEILKLLNYSKSVRAEEISVKDFIKISNYLN